MDLFSDRGSIPRRSTRGETMKTLFAILLVMFMLQGCEYTVVRPQPQPEPVVTYYWWPAWYGYRYPRYEHLSPPPPRHEEHKQKPEERKDHDTRGRDDHSRRDHDRR